MPLKKILFFLLLVCSLSGFSQIPELSPLSKISVLTCGPGDELYSSFGHSAFRVQDPTIGADIIYNYGIFDFRTKNFYLKFARGKLDYLLGRQRFSTFLEEYKYDNRWVTEQVLDLSLEEKNKLFQFLENNALPENRNYKYDFFYNNCATKIWDVLKENYGDALVFDLDYLEHRYTFRELIHQNLKMNSWSSFGIDLALGAVIDKKATAKEHLFLPVNVMRQLARCKLASKPLSVKNNSLFESTLGKESSNFLISPLFWVIALLTLVGVITIRDFKTHRRAKGLDFALFFLTGIVGLLMCFLWFLTDHTATVWNLNVLWAFPLNSVMAFVVVRKQGLPKWFQKYLLGLLGLLVFTIILGLFKIQVFSPLVFFIVIALGLRYAFLFLHQNGQTTGGQ